MKRTPEEILSRIEEVKDRDMFGTEQSDLISELPFENAKPFLKETARSEDWKPNERSPKQAIREYLPFAWDKANNCRGLSAARSLAHMCAWLWLDGHDNILIAELDDYEHYGKPQLVMISVIYGFDWKAVDDGQWVNYEGDNGMVEEERERLVKNWTEKGEQYK